MATTIKLPEEIIAEARKYAALHSRSLPKQVEYWFKIGKMAEENPDLPYTMLKDILLARAEVEAGETAPYVFGRGKKRHP